ncbi:unnamed protein product [Arctia plantaginis]|uniref:Uncharacterized protein n=1 Tax=Arctia plantaginis TaxID=874455 RepID=A0A8S0ZTQ8_ARCPL|nr:unnamed protein product [Arctia plantaginis]
MQRKPRGYKSTRFINEKRTKYKKGKDMENIDKDRVNHKQKNIIRQSKTQPKNKNYEIGAIGLYINTSHQVLYNDTHYSPYFDQLLGNYDINYLWSKQKIAKKFDESFKLPPSSLNRQILKPLSRNGNKNMLHTKVNQAPLALAFHGFTTQTDLFFKDTKKKKGEKLNQFVHLNKTPRQNNVLPKLGYELDSNLRLVISNIMSYMGYRNAEEETYSKNKEFGRHSYLPHGLMDWMGELRNKSKTKIKTIIEEDVVNNIKKIFSVKQQIDRFVNKTKEKVNQEIKEILEQEQPVIVANVSQSNTSKNASVRNKDFDLWHPWIHRVEDDVKVNSFIKEISNRNLRLFMSVGRKTKNKRWKKKLEDLAEMYKDKFNDFIIETSQHNIKSRRGTERVILNSVDVSNSIVKRLVNFVTDEVDKKGSLSNNSEVLRLIDKELKKETKTELKRACSKLNICRSSNGMSTFLADMATKIVGLEKAKFNESFNNLVQAIKKENYDEILDVHTDKGIQETMRRYERLPLLFQMAAMSAIKNMLTSVNKPFVMYDDIIVYQLDKTMAFFEIVKILDEKVPNSVDNINTWNNITSQDITNPDTMTEFVSHMKKVITELDDNTRNDILKQCKIIYP